MKHKAILISSLALILGGSLSLAGCEWTPFGRDYFSGSDSGKASSSYGEPWINSVTYGTVNSDTEHDKEKDFYLGVNFDKIINTTLEAGEEEVSLSHDIQKSIKSSLLDIMKDGASTDTESLQVHTLYSLFTDKEAREGSWERDILPHLKKLQEVSDLDELSAYLASDDYFLNGASIVDFDYDIDYNDTKDYCFVIVPSLLSLGDAAEYSQKSDYGKTTEDIYKKQSKLLLQKSGYSDDGADIIIDNSLKFETDLAAFMKTQEFKASDDYIPSLNNPVTISDIKAAEGAFPLDNILKAYGLEDAGHLYLLEPQWLEGLNNIYTEDNFEYIKSYILIKTLQSYAVISDAESYTKMRDIYNEAYGYETGEELEDYAYTFVKNELPGSLYRIYCDRYVDEKKADAAEALAKDIIASYKDIISSDEFVLKGEASEVAAKKMENMRVFVADASSTSSGLKAGTISEKDNLVSAVRNLRKADMERILSYLDREVSGEDYEPDVTETGVTYWNMGNTLVISAGALSDLSYSDAMSTEEKLAGLGTKIAAAAGEAYFGQGALYDETGKYNPYWTENDYSLYEETFKELKDFLNNIKPFKDDTRLDAERVMDSLNAEAFGFDAVKALSKKGYSFDYDKLCESFASSRFTLMREDVMERVGLNSSKALPYIVVNYIINGIQ